jgi:23S rRNA pseudouridine955/2504/2580 synthase
MSKAKTGTARTAVVDAEDDGIRLDRWFKRHMPDVSFALVSRWARTGQLRIDGARATPGDRIEEGQTIRIPPMPVEKKDRKITRLNSSHNPASRMPSSA